MTWSIVARDAFVAFASKFFAVGALRRLYKVSLERFHAERTWTAETPV
jgi:hypothetical protein